MEVAGSLKIDHTHEMGTKEEGVSVLQVVIAVF